MIKELTITAPSNACVPWFKTVPWLKKKRSLAFEPGVNILFGPNGSGKSTVLLSIAKMLHCAQGGVQKVTSESKGALLGNDRSRQDGVIPAHDGSPVVYFDPGATAGLIGGAFDYDFLVDGVQNAMFKGSAGQTTWGRSGAWISAVLENKWPEVGSTFILENWMQEVLKGSLEKDRPTVLLDEPSRSLDILAEINFWMNTVYLARRQKVQFIVATHSPFALGLPGVNYIETERGYLKKVTEAIAGRANLLDKVAEDLLVLAEGCGIADVQERRLKKEEDGKTK